MMYTLILMHIHWGKILIMLGGHKTVIGTVLRPFVVFMGGLLTISTGYVKMSCYINIYFYSK